MFVSTLLIALYILASTASAEVKLGDCYKCGEGSGGWSCPKETGQDIKPDDEYACAMNVGNSDEYFVCYEEYHNGIIFKRDCIPPNEVLGRYGCSKPDRQGTVRCYCNINRCNDGTDFKMYETTETSNNRKRARNRTREKKFKGEGSAGLGQMSIVFVLPVLVTWMSVAFTIGNHY